MHRLPWTLIMVAAVMLIGSASADSTISDLPFSDSIHLQNFYAADYTLSIGGRDGGSVSLYPGIKFNAVQYWSNVHYISMRQSYSSSNHGDEAIFSSLPDGQNTVWYKRPSDNTYHQATLLISRDRNLLGSITAISCYFFPLDWEVGTATGSYYTPLYYDNAGVIGSRISYFYGYPATYSIPVTGDTNTGGYFLFGNSEGTRIYQYAHYAGHAERYENARMSFNIESEFSSYVLDVTRVFSGISTTSSFYGVDSDGVNYISDTSNDDETYYIPISAISKLSFKLGSSPFYNYTLPVSDSGGTDPNDPVSFTLSLSPQTAAVGDPITATLTNIPIESSRLILNVNGVIHQDITNPYNFSAIGNSGETIYVFANCYGSSNNFLYSSNVVSYTLTGEIEPIEPYPDLEEVEITEVAPSYTQGNTLTATLNDNSIAGINEIWWKIIPQTDENGNPSTITGKRYEYKEFSTDNWQLKSGSSYTGSYTYADVKSLSHYIDGYGLFDVEVNCYNSTNGLIAIDRVNSYANPASYIKPVTVYIYGNSGLYSGEITLTTEYIVQSKNTTYYIYNGYDTINVVKAGDYNIYVDLTDNSIYKDKVLQYSYDSDGSILRIYLEEDYTVSEHAKLSIRVVDSSSKPLSFANVHFIGLAESSMTTNANGYAEYIGINNETVKFTASKNGYITTEGSIKLSEAINTFTLVLPLLTDTLTPTVTPTTPSSTSNPITNFINLIMSYGMNEEMAKLVLGLIISGGLFAIGVKFGESVGAGLAGAVLGIIFSYALNLIPMWIIVAILLCASVILASKLYGQG